MMMVGSWAWGQSKDDNLENEAIAKKIDGMKTLKEIVDTVYEGGLCNPSVEVDTTFYHFMYDSFNLQLKKVIVINHKSHIVGNYYFQDDYLLYFKSTKEKVVFFKDDYNYRNTRLNNNDPIWIEQDSTMLLAYKYILAFREYLLSKNIQPK